MSHQLASDQSQSASRTGTLGTAATKMLSILPALTPHKQSGMFADFSVMLLNV
jgi:hypothetical protein